MLYEKSKKISRVPGLGKGQFGFLLDFLVSFWKLIGLVLEFELKLKLKCLFEFPSSTQQVHSHIRVQN